MIKLAIYYMLGFSVGVYIGFYKGADSENFDREYANLKLQQCLEVIKK
jgi:hypothetical protein